MKKSKFPSYLFGNSEIPKRGDGTLFHFTKFKSFEKILSDMTLKPSSFEELNDLNEGNMNNLYSTENLEVIQEADRYMKKFCRLLCFSQNYEIDGIGYEGTNHPAMWAHYAENSSGVCIAIDKDSFIKKNEDVLNSHFYTFEDVTYNVVNTPKDGLIDYEAKIPKEFIRNNWKLLFFKKHKDWEYEGEHRLFIMDYDGNLSIDGCIKYIALGQKVFVDNDKIKALMDRVVDPNSMCFRKFIPHSFVAMFHSRSGYTTVDIAWKIQSLVEAYLSDTRYADYHRWLKEQEI